MAHRFRGDLTSLSVCGEPEFALGFLIFIQECQFPLQATLESVTTRRCLPTSGKNEVQLVPSSARGLPLCFSEEEEGRVQGQLHNA